MFFFVFFYCFLSRKVKSENCLLTANLIVKVCDFGLSRQLDEDNTLSVSSTHVTGKTQIKKLGDTAPAARMSMVSEYLFFVCFFSFFFCFSFYFFFSQAGTDEWMAPEVTLGQSYGLPADLFSFGIVLWEVALCKRPRKWVFDWVLIFLFFFFSLLAARLPQEYFEFPKEDFLSALPSSAPAGLASLTLDCCHLEPEQRPEAQKTVTRLTEMVGSGTAPPVVNSPKTARGFSPPTSPRRAIPAVTSIPSLSPK
jgi:serine/threonine protein kinase